MKHGACLPREGSAGMTLGSDDWINVRQIGKPRVPFFQDNTKFLFSSKQFTRYISSEERKEQMLNMAEAAIRLFTNTFSTTSTPALRDQRCDFIPVLSRRSSSCSSISSTRSTTSSSLTPSSEQAEETELQEWNYQIARDRTPQDEVERKKYELRERRAREAEGVWREFWH